MDDRLFALRIWQLEAGAKNGIFPVDDVTLNTARADAKESLEFFRQIWMQSMMRPL